MSLTRALQVILALGLLGTAFSGTLAYRELFTATALSCPSPGAPGTILGYPACVYGLVFYLTIVMVAVLGLWGRRPEVRHQASHSI